MRSIRKKVFAWFMRRGNRVNLKLYGGYKNDLFKDLAGTVLDLGAGTGLNMSYAPSGVTRWIAVEPNSAFHPDIVSESSGHPFRVDVTAMDAHRLELPDQSVDAVISTLVLCSVRDPQKVLSEILRVLQPGGAFYFIEHVVSDTQGLRLAQYAFNPLNRAIADGCNCNRDTRTSIARSGLVIDRIATVRVKGITWFHAPHIMGVALKPQKT